MEDAYIGNNKMRYDQCDMNPGSGYVGSSCSFHLGGTALMCSRNQHTKTARRRGVGRYVPRMTMTDRPRFATLFCFAMFIFIFLAAAADTAYVSRQRVAGMLIQSWRFPRLAVVFRKS